MRRDVKLLADAGLLARFHGGVRVPSSTTENIAYRQRQQLNAQGEAAHRPRGGARRCRDGCSLIINIGTTTEAIARELLHHKGLRVITNNLNVAAILSDNPDCEVIVAGGMVRSRDRGIVGEATVDFIRQFRVDIGLIGISGIEGDGTPARLRLPRGEGGARDHRALARGLARRRPQQVQPAGDGRAGAPRPDRRAVHRPAAAARRSRRCWPKPACSCVHLARNAP